MDVTQAETLADQICGCANREQHRRDVALLNEAFAAHRQAALLEGIRMGLEAAAGTARLDVDWTHWADKDFEPWANGKDSLRDYRLGIAVGESVAGAIATLDPAAVLARHGGA